MANDTPPPDWATNVKNAFEAEVREAKRLLDFAVKRGLVSADGRGVSDNVVLIIKKAEDLLAGDKPVPAAERAEFERAYRDLAQFVSPVTAATLEATAEEGEAGWATDRRWGKNLAMRWSRRLWVWTIIFMALAVTGETLELTFGAAAPPIDDEVVSRLWGWALYVPYALLATLLPFTYGGLGACAYLLRSAHNFIHQRCFDPQRIPEYNSRILLGVVGGGAIVFLVAEIPDGSGGVIELSAKALGFIAGYNSDFLFNTIERIVAALLPKIRDTTVRRAEPKPRVMSEEQALIEGLLDRLRISKDEEEKKTIRGLLERFGATQ